MLQIDKNLFFFKFLTPFVFSLTRKGGKMNRAKKEIHSNEKNTSL